MERYDKLGIPYFNPQVDDWKPELAAAEAWHLANDPLVLFPVTRETYGTGSLAETGFSALHAMNVNRRCAFIMMIDKDLDPALDDPVARKESLRSRALVSAHLGRQTIAGLYVVASLDDMLDLSLVLHQILVLRGEAERFRRPV